MPFNGSPSTDTVQRAVKTVTFTGGAGAGAVGSVAVFTVTGRVLVHAIAAFCTTDLTEALATASISLGTTNQTTRFIANPTGGPIAIDANEWWTGTTPTVGSIDITGGSAGATDQQSVLVSEAIILTIGTQAVNGGVLDIYCLWEPLSANGSLVAA